MSVIKKMRNNAEKAEPVKKPAAKKAAKKPPSRVGPPPTQDAEGLTDALNRVTETNRSYWKNSGTISPSSRNQCPRFIYYRLEGYMHEEKISGQLQRIFDQGKDLEDRLLENFARLEVLLDHNVEIRIDEPPVRGFIDAIIHWAGKDIVVECKSINEAGYLKVKAFKSPKDEHYRQIQLYMAATGHLHGYVIYINKNTNQYLVLDTPRDDEFIEKTLKKYGIIYKAWENKEIPKRPYKGKSSKTCQSCNAKNYCWDMDDREGTPVSL